MTVTAMRGLSFCSKIKMKMANFQTAVVKAGQLANLNIIFNEMFVPGAYLGGWAMVPCPPLSCQNSIISIEYYAKLWHGPPSPFATWAESLSTQKDRIWVKTCFVLFFLVFTKFWAKKRTIFD